MANDKKIPGTPVFNFAGKSEKKLLFSTPKKSARSQDSTLKLFSRSF